MPGATQTHPDCRGWHRGARPGPCIYGRPWPLWLSRRPDVPSLLKGRGHLRGIPCLWPAAAVHEMGAVRALFVNRQDCLWLTAPILPCEPCTPTSFDTCPSLCRWVERDAARSRQEAEKWGRGKPNAQELLMLLGIYFCCLRERTVWGLSTVIQPNDWSGTK